jgi:rare lipoprotein A
MLAVALALSVAFALAPAAPAQSTGGTAAPEPGTGGEPAGAPDGSVLRAGRGALHGRAQLLSGRLAGAGAGLPVLIQRSAGAGWVTVARATTGREGAFAVRWVPDRVGRFTLRAVPGGAQAAAAAAGPATARVTVYRTAIATHFGPGFFGTRTACGVVLTPATVGVAHTTLPCGTLVEFYYRGRTVRAPVLDRGPYANNAVWDLTTAASRALRFNGKDYVGSITVGRVVLSRR